MGDLSVICSLFKEKIMCLSQKIKSNHRVIRKYEVDIHGAPVFEPDYITAVLAAKMCTISNEHSMYTRSLCLGHSGQIN